MESTQFSPPIGYKTIHAEKTEDSIGMDKHVKKTFVVTSTMPTSYPTPFEAAPTVISSWDGGLIITTYTSISG